MKTIDVRARLEPATHAKLKAMARREGLSMNWLINKAIKDLIKKGEVK